MRDLSRLPLALVLLAGLGFGAAGAFGAGNGQAAPDERAFVPAEQMSAAIEAATGEQPGQVGGAVVEQEDNGSSTLVEVVVRAEEGTVYTVEVVAGTNEIEEVEEGIEPHHRIGSGSQG